ncbi:MAG: galactokinase [Mucilaginibacter polytrichastri]|nr:galactokinase [Mucilaginibacter polytrichastri]
MKKKDQLTSLFKERFDAEPLLVRSPGRVNLIGEHTDYNNGFVLPAAINKNIYMAVQKRGDRQIHLVSADYNDEYQTSLDELKPSGKLWPDYMLGVADQLVRKGHVLGGFNAVFTGDIPQGAGLSSSAALECATGFALSEIFHLGLKKADIALTAQAAENEFVGVRCGIMDQFSSVFGREKRLIKLDCATLNYEYIPFNTDDLKIVLFDSQVKHSLASSAYNERREQCEKGVALISEHVPGVFSLRDASIEMLDKYVKPVDETVYRRCHYVVSEIRRLQDACDDLTRNDFEQFGKRMFETHDGLSNDYEVSCRELDILVDLVRGNEAVLGARMMGGGFGGCTINLVRSADVDKLISEVAPAYLEKTGTETRAFVAQIENGTSILEGVPA